MTGSDDVLPVTAVNAVPLVGTGKDDPTKIAAAVLVTVTLAGESAAPRQLRLAIPAADVAAVATVLTTAAATAQDQVRQRRAGLS